MNGKSGSRPAITAVLCGAGFRGSEAYGSWALKNPKRLKFIAVADPNPEKRKLFQELHGIQPDFCFESWEEMLNDEIGKIADVCFVCTPDRAHYEPTIRALELNYNILLEKPIAPTVEQCQQIEKLASEKNRLVQIAHVLRFTPFFKKIKEIIDSGEIGKILHYEHSENVSAPWHFGHSYVRGWYKNAATSSPMIMAKSCHDLDLIHWIIGDYPTEVVSTADLTFYKPENAPPGAPERCTDGCPHSDTCTWYAPRMYVDLVSFILPKTNKNASNSLLIRIAGKILIGLINHKKLLKFLSIIIPPLRKFEKWDRFPVSAITDDFTLEGRIKALKEGQFGLCVFKAGNDVMDHHVSTYLFPNGVISTLLVHGFSEWEGRELRIMGSKGTLRGIFRDIRQEIIVTNLRTNKTKRRFKSGLTFSGHGGGDTGLMTAMTSYLLGEKTREEAGLTDISSAMESHYMGFAAEEARINHKMVEMKDIRP
jgi:hypothetical protein